MPAAERRKFLSFIVVALLLAAVSLTLVSGIYPDEVATKITLERYFISGGFRQNLEPACMDGFLIAPSFLLVPAAALWAQLILLGSGWLSYRFIPYVGLVVVLLVLIHHNRKNGNHNFWPLLLFITFGTTLFSITILRPEILMLASCMALFFLGSYMMSAQRACELYLCAAISLLLYSIIAFVHPKAIYLVAVPAAAVTLSASRITLARHRYLYVAIFIVGLLLITSAAVALFQKAIFSCQAIPELQKTTSMQSVNPLDSYFNPNQFFGELQLAFGKKAFDRSLTTIFYRHSYQADFLPITPASHYAWLINILIALAWAGFGIYSFIKFFRCLIKTRDPAGRREFYLIASVVLALLVPFALNITKNFYEVGFLGCALMVITTLLWPLYPRADERRWATITAAISMTLIALSLLCILLSYRHIVLPLLDGYRGPDIPAFVDRTALDRRIRSMLADAHVASSESLVVSDLTYEAVKYHPYVAPITYLPLAFVSPGVTRTAMEKFGFRYGIVECNSLNGLVSKEFPADVLKTAHVAGVLYGIKTNFDICLFKLNY